MLIRCYYISDSIVEHFITHDTQEYIQMLGSYLDLLLKSNRLMRYRFGSCELSPMSYAARRAAANQWRNSAIKEAKETRRNLRVVEDV